MITVENSGSFDNTEQFLKRARDINIFSTLEHYGREGVRALAAATPRDEGETARAWTYEIVRDKNSWSIVWGNTHVKDGRPIAILLQYGHATRTGGRVEGRDYINTALKPIFDRIQADARKVVSKR